MSIQFDKLPLNTKQIYAMVKDKSGCEIYIPAISEQHAKILKKKLESFLESQPEPDNEPDPICA